MKKFIVKKFGKFVSKETVREFLIGPEMNVLHYYKLFGRYYAVEEYFNQRCFRVYPND